MEKTEFIYVRWIRKYTYAFVIIVVAVAVLDVFVSKLFGFRVDGILGIAKDTLLVMVGWYVYYRYVNRRKLFSRKGYYWVSDGVVYIQTERRTYLLTRIKKVAAVTLSFLFDFKCGHLSIAFEDEELVLVSQSNKSIKNFFDCELAPLLNAILDNNPQLIENKESCTWETK